MTCKTRGGIATVSKQNLGLISLSYEGLGFFSKTPMRSNIIGFVQAISMFNIIDMFKYHIKFLLNQK